MSEFRRKLMMSYAANLGRGDIVYPGLIAAWSAKGKSNDDEDRAILKDLTGNGHDISLKGFAFNGMSGFGGNLYGNYKYHFDKIGNFQTIVPTSTIIGNLKLDIRGLTDFREEITTGQIELIKYRIIDGATRYEYIKEDGSYDISFNTKEFNKFQLRFLAPANISHPCNIDIEILPEYPDALVFDGVDDYGINEEFPSLNDYTVILTVKKISYGDYYTFMSKSKNGNEGSFMIRTTDVLSYGHAYAYVDVGLEPFTQYFTPTNCNGNMRIRGSFEDPIGLVIGRSRTNNTAGNLNMAFYSAYLFNRSLDEQEIKSFIRKHIDPEYLLPSEIEAINNSLVAKTEEVS